MGYNLMEGWLIDQNVRSDDAIHAVLSRAVSLPEVSGLLSLPGQLGVELWANRSFYSGRPIVPQGLTDQYQEAPYLQYSPRTPAWAIWLGRQVNASPIKIEYAARQLLMPAGVEMFSAPGRIAKGIDEPSDLPMVGRLFAYEPRGFWSASGQEMGERRRRWEGLLAERRRLLDGTDEQGPGDRRLAEIVKELDGLAGSSRRYQEMERRWKDIKAEQAKAQPDQARIRSLEQQMTALARAYLKAESAGGAAAPENEADRLSDRVAARQRQLEQQDTSAKARNQTMPSEAVRELRNLRTLSNAANVIRREIDKGRADSDDLRQRLLMVLRRAAEYLPQPPQQE
jgi:hypothetical protein